MPQFGSRFPLDWMGILVTRLPAEPARNSLFGYARANSGGEAGIQLFRAEQPSGSNSEQSCPSV